MIGLLRLFGSYSEHAWEQIRIYETHPYDCSVEASKIEAYANFPIVACPRMHEIQWSLSTLPLENLLTDSPE